MLILTVRMWYVVKDPKIVDYGPRPEVLALLALYPAAPVDVPPLPIRELMREN